MNMTRQEYLELCQSLLDSQYLDPQYSEDDPDVEMNTWIPAEPEIKKKRESPDTRGSIDLTKAKKDKIKEALYKCDNLKIYDFTIRIRHYSEEQDFFQITVYEDKTKTPSGQPCKMTYPVNVDKDGRFAGRPWLNHFQKSRWGVDVPSETMIDIIRFLQITKKLSAFI